MGLSVYPPSSGVTTSDLITVPQGTYIGATSTTSSNISFSNIPQTYRALRLYWYVRPVQAGSVRIRLNNDTSFTYTLLSLGWVGGSGSVTRVNNTDGFVMPGQQVNSDSVGWIEIQNYNKTNELKPIVGVAYGQDSSSRGFNLDGVWPALAAVTGINLVHSSGDVMQPLEFNVNVYGVK